VAVFNEKQESASDGIAYLEKHKLTDEVFILLKGSCWLWIAGGAQKPGELQCVAMEPLKCYNVKKST